MGSSARMPLFCSGATGIPIELLSSTGGMLATTYTDVNGNYSFGSLPDIMYLVTPTAAPGEFSAPLEQPAFAGGLQANFKMGGVPESVTVTGPSLANALFTQQQWSGPPPCQGAGCPVSYFGQVPPSGLPPLTLSIPNGVWWLTCYLPPNYTQTSSQQLTLVPQQSTSLPCPP
jgi:hypothetical protein